MPLTRYQIRNEYSLADPELYKAADRDDPEALLEGLALAGLVGVLRQLGDLAEFAAEIFHDLHEEVTATAARGHGLMVRVQQLELEVPSIEKAFLSQTNHTPFFSNAGVDWHPNLCTEQNLITCGDLPRCVMDSYEECRGPPHLFLLDKFDVAGAGACLKRYTDPSFFKVDTAPSDQSVEVHRERKFRKVKQKKGSRLKNGETPEIVPTSHAKLHQLFLEESVKKGHSDPTRLVKLKKRQLNASPFDSKNIKSYMGKFFETPIECNEDQKFSVAPLLLKLTSDNSSESGLEMSDITTVSHMKAKSQGKEITCSSPNDHEVVPKPYMDELCGEVVDRQIVKVPEPTADGEREEIPYIFHKVMDEKEIVIDGEGKPESSVDGDNSDDLSSEIDNYMDALTTMESEMEADHENRLKSDFGCMNVEKHGTDPDRNGEQLELEAHSSDSHSIENFSASDDGNSSFKKGRSRFSYSDTHRNLAETTPSDDEGSAKVFPTSETFIPENTQKPPNQLPADVTVPRTKPHDLMLPNHVCIDEDNICSVGEVSSNSSLVDSNNPLHPLDHTTTSLHHQSEETPSESMKPGFAISYCDERETNLVDSSAAFSDMPSQTSDGTPYVVSSESHSVDKLDVGDPHISSDFLLHSSNNSELAPGKKSSNDSLDEVLWINFAEKSFSDNTVDIKIGSLWSYASPNEEQVPSSVLSEVEGSDAEKKDDLNSEVVDTLAETEVCRESSTSIGDALQGCGFQEQQLSDIVDNLPLVELESAEETTLYSEEENIAETSGTADSKKRGASTCKVDAVDREAVPPELLSNYTDCSVVEDRAVLDDVVVESVQAEHMALSLTVTDDVPAVASEDDAAVVCPPEELIHCPSKDTLNYGSKDPLEDELKCKKLVPLECLTGPEEEVSPKGVDSVLCKFISCDESKSQMVDGVQNSLDADLTQNSLPAGDITIPPAASGLGDQQLESKSFQQSHLLDGGEDAMSSPAVHPPDLETSSEQPMELQADLLDVVCMKAEASSYLQNHPSGQIQSLDHTDQEGHSEDISESCQEDLPSEPSTSGYLQQSTGQEINNSKREMDSLSSAHPSFSLLPEAAQVHLEEMPPLPPLPPMQWRLGKIQHASPVPHREFMDQSLESVPSILPFTDQEKVQFSFPAQQSDTLKLASPFLFDSAVEVVKTHNVSQQVDNVMQPSLSSLQLPFMAIDANSQTNSHGLEGSQSPNPILTLSALPDEKPEHGFLASDCEVVQSSSNPFEHTASNYDHPASSSEKLILPLNQSASDSCLQHTSDNLEGEHGNPSGISVLPPRKVEDTNKYDLVSSPKKLIHPLNHSASEPVLQHASENLEGKHGNPSYMSVPPGKVEDTASAYEPVSTLEKPIHTPNQSASVPGLQNASEDSDREHWQLSDTSRLPPRKVKEQPQHGLPSLEGESAWSSNPFAPLATSEVAEVIGSSMVKLPRLCNPLIDAVAALDKSRLRKVTERVWPQSESKVDERNSLLEQIRTKSFNLKPAVVSRPSIQGPQTNLRVAAILEKANAIRQATAGSDEEDEEDWSDS